MSAAVVWKRRGKWTPHAWLDGVSACAYTRDGAGRVAPNPNGPPPWRELRADELAPTGLPFGKTCAWCAHRVLSETRAETPTQARGFAVMDRSLVREIARKGGLAAQDQGVAHRWTPDEAKAAGRKGGLTGAGARARAAGPLAPLDDRPLWRRALEARRASR